MTTQNWCIQTKSQTILALIPDELLRGGPESVADSEGGAGKFPPHIRLWAAVLRRASVDYALYCNHPMGKLRRIGEDAAEWLLTDCDDDDVFNSFVAVCEHLDLSPSSTRQSAVALTEEAARKLRGMEFDDA